MAEGLVCVCVTVHYIHLASLSNKKIIIVSLDWKANAKSGKIRKVESRCHLSILKSPLDNVDFLRDASVIVPRLNAQTRSQMQSDRNNNSNETLARGEEEEEFKVHSTSISVCRRHFRANGREGGGGGGGKMFFTATLLGISRVVRVTADGFLFSRENGTGYMNVVL